MTYGPINFIALEFQGNRFRGEILSELIDLVDRNIMRRRARAVAGAED